jgi:chromosome segregation ATPase
VPGGSYDYDQVFHTAAKNVEVYDRVAKNIVLSTMEGKNGTIFAYGQTSSGKTHTMMGNETELGVIPLAIHEIFEHIDQSEETQFCIRVSTMEIYNETISDLLDSTKTNCKIKENYSGDVFVDNLTEKPVSTPEEMMAIMTTGLGARQVASTKMNDTSSRSHTIFRVVVESKRHDDPDGAVRSACLNLVDLAGSERVRNTGAAGERLKEAGNINKSLLTLGSVIQKLSEGTKDSSHIPYRDSKLTRILQNSLGGNARTAMICAVTPSAQHSEETISSLKFASRAANITNDATVNEILDDEAQMKRYQRTIMELEKKVSLLEESRLNGGGTVSGESQDAEKEQLATDLVKQEALFREQKAEIDRLKSLVLQGSPRKVAPTGRSKSNGRRKTWCPGQTGSGNKAGGMTLMQTPMGNVQRKISRRSMAMPTASTFDNFGVDGGGGGGASLLGVSMRDKRSRRSVMLPPPLDDLTDQSSSSTTLTTNVDVELLQKRNTVLESKLSEQAGNIATLKDQLKLQETDAAGTKAELDQLKGQFEAKQTEFATFEAMETNYKDKIAVLHENEGFMQEELEVWQAECDQGEGKLERMISPSRLTKAEKEMETKLAEQEVQHKDLVSYLEETIKGMEAKAKSGQLSETLTEINTTLTAEIEALKTTHKAELASVKEQSEAGNSSTQDEIAELNQMLDELSNKNIQLDAQLITKDDLLAGAKESVEQLKASLEAEKSVSLEATTKATGQAEEIEAVFTATIAELEGSVATAGLNTATANAKIAGFEAASALAAAAHTEMASNMQIEIDSAKTLLDTAMQAAADLGVELEGAQAEAGAAAGKVESMEATIITAIEAHAAVVAELDAAKVQLAAAMQSADQMSTETSTELESSKVELASVRAELETAYAQAESTHMTLNAEVEELVTMSAQLQTDLAHEKEQHDAAKEQLALAADYNQQFEATFTVEAEAAKVALGAAQDELVVATAKVVALENTLQSTNEMHVEAACAHALANAQLEAAAEASASAAKELVCQLEDQTAAFEAVKSEFTVEFEEAQFELAAELISAETTVAALETAVANADTKSAHHYATLAQLEAATAELAQLEAVNEQLQMVASAHVVAVNQGGSAATPKKTPKKGGKIFSAIKSVMSAKKQPGKKKRKLFGKGAAMGSPSSEDLYASNASARPMVDRLVTPAKRSASTEPDAEEPIAKFELFAPEATVGISQQEQDQQGVLLGELQTRLNLATTELIKSQAAVETLDAELQTMADVNSQLQACVDRQQDDLIKQLDAASAEKRSRAEMSPSGETPVRPAKQHAGDYDAADSSAPPPMTFEDEAPVQLVIEGMLDGITMEPVVWNKVTAALPELESAEVLAGADLVGNADAAAAQITANAAEMDQLRSDLDAAVETIAVQTESAEQLQTQLDAATADLEDLQLTVAESSTAAANAAQVEAVQSELEAARAETVTLTSQNEEMEDKYLENLDTINDLETELTALKTDSTAIKVEMESAVQVLHSTQAELTSAIIQKEAFETELTEMTAQLENAMADLESISAAKEQAEAQLGSANESFEAELAAATEHAQQLDEQVLALEQQIEQGKKFYTSALEDLQLENAELSEHCDAAAVVGEQNAALEQELEATKVQLATANSQLAVAVDGLADVQREVAQLHEERAAGSATSEQLDQLKIESKQQQDDADVEVANLQTQIEGMSTELEQERTANRTLQEAQMDAMIETERVQEETACEYAAEIKTLHAKITDLQGACAQLKQTIASSSSAETVSAEEMEALQTQLAKAKQDAQEQKECFEASDEYNQGKVQEYEEIMGNLQNELEEVQSEQSDATAQARDAKGEVTKLAQYIAKLEAETKQVDVLKQQVADVTQQLAAAKTKAAAVITTTKVTGSGIMDSMTPRKERTASKPRARSAHSMRGGSAPAPLVTTAAAALAESQPKFSNLRTRTDRTTHHVAFAIPDDENTPQTPEPQAAPAPAPAVVATVASPKQHRVLKDKNISSPAASDRPVKKAREGGLSLSQAPSTPSTKLQSSWQPAPAADAAPVSSSMQENIARKSTSHRSNTAALAQAANADDESPECATQ